MNDLTERVWQAIDVLHGSMERLETPTPLERELTAAIESWWATTVGAERGEKYRAVLRLLKLYALELAPDEAAVVRQIVTDSEFVRMVMASYRDPDAESAV
uniref:hypothetical protein n=1 Tax=Streptomyces sp. CA-136453 TaxID=3240050 RepID=UPI003F49211F